MSLTEERLDKLSLSVSSQPYSVILELVDEIERLQSELIVAKERFGPAGYKIISEVAELRKELAAVKMDNKTAGENFTLACEQRDSWREDYLTERTLRNKLHEKNEKLKEALQFYARATPKKIFTDEALARSDQTYINKCRKEVSIQIAEDGGEIARQAIKETERE